MTVRPIEERQIGSVKVTVVHLEQYGVYSVALVDQYGVAGSLSANKKPCENCLDQAVRRLVHLSQAHTRRN